MPSDTMTHQACDWATIPFASAQAAFRECSHEAADTLRAIQMAPGEHMLREDVPECLRRAAGRRELAAADAAAILRCFRMDTSGTISLAEFERSWHALQQLEAEPQGEGGRIAGKQRRPGVVAAVAVGMRPAAATTQPPTASREVGWLHAAAPLPARERQEGGTGRYVPLAGSDVTRGGEGRSASSYFGIYL